MTSLGDLFITVGANIGNFSAAMGDVNDALKKSAREAKATSAGWSEMFGGLQKIGVGLTATITAPLVGMGVVATQAFNAFELGMRQVTSLMGNVTQKEFKDLSDQTLELSKRLGIDAVKAAQGLYEAISAGVPKENALSFMEVASKAAIAGVTDTKVAVDGLTSIMNAYKLESSRTQEVADAMFQAVNIGKFTFEQLAGSISIATPLASKLGVSFQDLLGAAASMTKQGFSVSEAMSSIRGAMNALITPNKEMNALFAKMGVTSGEALIRTDGLQGAMVKLEKAAGGSTQKLSEALGRVEALGSVLALTGDNAKQAAVDIAAIGNSAGAATLAFDQINKSSARAFDRMKAQFQNLAINLGGALAPAIEKILTSMLPLVKNLQEAVEWFAKLDGPTQTTILGFTALAAAAGPLLVVLGTLGQSIIVVTSAAKIMGITMSGLMASIPWVALTVSIGMLVKGLYDYKGAVDNLKGASKEQSDSLAKLEISLRQQGVNISALTKQYNNGEISQQTYIRGLVALAKAHGDTVPQTEAHAKATVKLGEAAKVSANATEDAAKALKHAESVLGVSKINTAEATAAYNLLFAAWNVGKISVEELQKAYATLQQRLVAAGQVAASVVTPVWVALGQAQDHAAQASRNMLTAISDMINAGEAWGKKLPLVAVNLLDLTKNSDLLRYSMERLGQVLGNLSQIPVDPLKALKGSILETSAIMRDMGAKSTLDLTTEAEKLGDQYLRIVQLNRENKATTLDVKAAYEAWMEASRKAAGITTTATQAQKKGLQEISTIVNDLSRSVSRGIINLFKGNGAGEQLKAEATSLRAGADQLRQSLTERAMEWDRYQQDVTEKLGRIQDSLNETVGDSTRSANRRIEDENKDFARDTERLNADLQEALKKRDAVRAAEIRRDLANRVADHATALKRIGEDLEESVSDAKKRAAEQTADAKKELERRAADNEKSIAATNQQLESANQKLLEVANKQSTIWKSISGFIGGAMEAIGESILRNVIQHLVAASGIADKLASILGSIFGGGASAAAGAAGTVAGGAASAAGGVASTAGTATSAASTAVASSLSGWIGAIGSAATAVSSIVSNFQNMAMNKSLDLIEHETRFSQLHLLHLLENSNQWWPKLNHLVDVWGAIGDLPARLQEQFTGGFAGVTAAGGGGVTFQINGGYFLSSRALDEFMEEVIRRLKQRNA